MAKKNSYRICALLMAFLMFFTSSSYSIDLHFCQGQLKSFSLIGKAKSCHEMAKMAKCHQSKKTCTQKSASSKQIEDNKGCCNNETLLLTPNTDFDKILANEVTSQKQETTSAAIPYSTYEYSLKYSVFYSLLNRPPPLLNKDVLILIQSFLL